MLQKQTSNSIATATRNCTPTATLLPRSVLCRSALPGRHLPKAVVIHAIVQRNIDGVILAYTIALHNAMQCNKQPGTKSYT